MQGRRRHRGHPTARVFTGLCVDDRKVLWTWRVFRSSIFLGLGHRLGAPAERPLVSMSEASNQFFQLPRFEHVHHEHCVPMENLTVDVVVNLVLEPARQARG